MRRILRRRALLGAGGLVALERPRARSRGYSAGKTAGARTGRQTGRRALGRLRDVLIVIVLLVIVLSVLIVLRRRRGLADRLLLGVRVRYRRTAGLLLVVRLFEPAAELPHDGTLPETLGSIREMVRTRPDSICYTSLKRMREEES
jgi:hypothetical protein